MPNLEHLQPGDKVALWYRQGFGNLCVEAEVERVTKTRIVVKGDGYSRQTGYKIGDTGYHRNRIELLDDENRTLIQMHERLLQTRYLQRKITEKLPDLPLETLEAIAAVIWPKGERETDNQDEGYSGA